MNLDLSAFLPKVVKAIKADKKAIFRFYKTQHYPAKFIGQDTTFVLKMDNEIIGSAIISAGRGTCAYWLLHGLVIDNAHRGKGLASHLLQSVLKENHKTKQFPKLICFAEQKLMPFYLTNQFQEFNSTSNIESLPVEFQQRFKNYQQKKPTLCCFAYFAE